MVGGKPPLLAARLPELIALVLLAVGTVTIALVQTAVDAPRRRTVRQMALEEQLAAEVEQTRWRGSHL